MWLGVTGGTWISSFQTVDSSALMICRVPASDLFFLCNPRGVWLGDRCFLYVCVIPCTLQAKFTLLAFLAHFPLSYQISAESRTCADNTDCEAEIIQLDFQRPADLVELTAINIFLRGQKWLSGNKSSKGALSCVILLFISLEGKTFFLKQVFMLKWHLEFYWMKLPVVLPEELNHSSHLKPSALSCPCGVSGLYRWLLEEKGDKAELWCCILLWEWCCWVVQGHFKLRF